MRALVEQRLTIARIGAEWIDPLAAALRDVLDTPLVVGSALTLGPLTEEQSHELAVRRLAESSRADEVVRIAEGNPLFIEQIAASIGETSSGTLPTSVRGIVAARLDALPRAERSLLLEAAVIGKVFWVDALRSTEAPDVERLLAELERRDLVRREPVSIIEGQRQYAFTHVLIRDVAYDLLPRADRARRHALVAEFFERSTGGGGSGEAVAALARHWREAGDHERSVRQLVRSAEQAERGWAKDHAAFLYREALQLVPPEDTEQRSVLRRRLALASTASFHLDDVRRQESPQA